MKTYLFGAGKAVYTFLEFLKCIGGKNEVKIRGIVDNNESLWGNCIDNIKIYNPEVIKKEQWDFILVTSSYEKEIRKQLIEMGIKNDKIILGMDYLANLFVKEQYYKRYGKNHENKNERKYDLSKLVIYTAIMGGYDSLKEPLFNAPEIKYVCFTDNMNLKSNIWDIQRVNVTDGNDCREKARWLKLQPHKLFPEYTTSVWIDASFQIKEDIRSYIKRYERDTPILCYIHSRRNTVYEEANACIEAKRGNISDIKRQIEQYRLEGYTALNGLYETGCIVRQHNNSECIKIMDTWVNELEKYSLRDQISFPYVCWKANFQPDICDKSIYDNEWIEYLPHNRYY